MRDLTKSAEHRLRRAVIAGLSTLIRRTSPPPAPSDLTHARILLIRQDRIGDVLVSTPFIRVLKTRRPSITLDMLVSPNNQMALDGIPQIGKRWVYVKSLSSIIRLLRQIRRERYDVAIDLMDNPSATSTLLCLLSAARWSFGIAKENEFIYDVKVPLLSRRDVHIVRRIAELLRPFGIDPDDEDLRLSFEPGTDADTRARRALLSAGLWDRRCLCVNISAGSRSRYWGVQNFQSLVGKLEDAYPSNQIVVASAPGDRGDAERIAGSSRHARLLPPTTDFRDFAALLRPMECIITPDTAVVHIAAAFRVPAVVLFIQTDADLRIWDPYDSPHRSLISREDTLLTISPDAVVAAVAELVKDRPRTRRRGPAKKR